MALPRLTGALRSFSNVTKQDNYRGEVADIKMKRSKLHEKNLDLGLTWTKIVKFLNENLDKNEVQNVNEDLKDILQAAKQIDAHLVYSEWQQLKLNFDFCTSHTTLTFSLIDYI